LRETRPNPRYRPRGDLGVVLAHRRAMCLFPQCGEGGRRQDSLSCAAWCAALRLRIIPMQRVCGRPEVAEESWRR
jgi:hypothetical protein